MKLPSPIVSSRSAIIGDSILHHFLATAEMHADCPAIRVGSETMTYRQLTQKALHLAAQLQAHGVQRGDSIGLAMPRCAELPISLFAILFCGAAYIPLDPAYPPARLEQMIHSARLSKVLLTSASLGSFPTGIEQLVFTELLAAPERIYQSPEYHEDDAFYAIFTSGSTGIPKAAGVSHRGFRNLLDWYIMDHALSEHDRTLVLSSPSFDLTQKNFFAPLLTGGMLVLDDGLDYDLLRLLNTIKDQQITLINCTPSAFYPLVNHAAADSYQALQSLRHVVLGGEPISIKQLAPWLEHENCNAVIVNSYGPTECTDVCASYRLTALNLHDYPFVPLGSEIPNALITLRDESLKKVSTGEIGELCIEGAGVGHGYLHDPERTAQVFINGLYRTGDLARRLPNGLLEFRGRADQQVKINGFRIELGDVEQALKQFPGVTDAVAVVSNDALVAHLQGREASDDLRTFLTGIIPSHLVPSLMFWHEAFPLTPNGKVDRLALKSRSQSKSITPQKTPSSELQNVLTLWSEILGTEVTDPSANFFDLGGNSIHLATLHARLHQMTSKKFPITALFGLPTAKSIAEFLTNTSQPNRSIDVPQRAQRSHASFHQFRNHKRI